MGLARRIREWRTALREFRRVLDFERGRIVIFTIPPELKETPAAPYPLATRGHFYEDEELERLPRDAGSPTRG